MQEVSQFTDKMGYGIVFYICVIALLIALKNIRKMNGTTSRKLIYLILVAVVSVVAVFSYATKFRIEVMIENPLAFMSILMILIHLIFKKYAFHWIEFGVSPFSKKHPIEKFSWSGTELYVKVRYIGIGLCVLSFYQAREVWFFYFMFIIGIILLMLSYSMNKKEYRIVIGATILMCSILFSDWVLTSTLYYILFYAGLTILIWGFIRLRQAKKLASRKLHSNSSVDLNITSEESDSSIDSNSTLH